MSRRQRLLPDGHIKGVVSVIIGTAVILPAVFFSSALHSAVIDGVIAQVGDRIITVSDVITEAKIIRIMEMEKGSVILPVTASFHQEILEQMINKELIYQEARRLRLYDGDIEVVEEMLVFENRFYNPEEFRRFLGEEGITVDDLAERFTKEKTGAAFLADRLSMMITVSGKEIEDFFIDNPHLFEGKELEEVKKEIKGHLYDKKGAALLDKLMADIKRRGKVRYFEVPSIGPPF